MELPAHLLPVSTRLYAQIHTQLLITGLTDCVNLNEKLTLPVQADPTSYLRLTA